MYKFRWRLILAFSRDPTFNSNRVVHRILLLTYAYVCLTKSLHLNFPEFWQDLQKIHLVTNHQKYEDMHHRKHYSFWIFLFGISQFQVMQYCYVFILMKENFLCFYTDSYSNIEEMAPCWQLQVMFLLSWQLPE